MWSLFFRGVVAGLFLFGSPLLLVADSRAQPPADEPGHRIVTSTPLPDGVRVVGIPELAPVGNRIAVIVEVDGDRGSLRHLLVDGEVGPGFHFLDGVAFSRDGTEIAYRAGMGVSDDRESWRIIRDGKALPALDWVGAPTFVEKRSGNRTVAYRIGPGVRMRAGDRVYVGGEGDVVVGRTSLGVKTPDAVSFDPVVVDRTGRRIAFTVALAGHRHGVAIDGKIAGRHVQVRGPVFGPKGRHVAYGAYDGNAWRIVRDGKPEKDARENIGPLAFGPRGRLACGTASGARWTLMVDGRAVGPLRYAFIGDAPVFSPMGRHVAYIANRGGTRDSRFPPGMTFPPSDGTWHVVVGEKEGPAFSAIRDLVVTEKGVPIYVGLREGVWELVRGSQAVGVYEAIGAPQLTDDDRFRVALLDEGELRVVSFSSDPPARD